MKRTVMTTDNPRWEEFAEKLDKKLNTHKVGDKFYDGCTETADMPFATEILKKMDMNVEKSKEHFRDNGATCDHEIIFNWFMLRK
jgi:hypothetical protein